MQILIADDERPARAELRYILSSLLPTADFHEARTGQEALDLIAQQPVDVVFLDINMPGQSGLAVATAVMAMPEHDARPRPLIVFATAYDAHAVRAFELAALDYVVKPFSEQRIAQTVGRIRETLAQRNTLVARYAALEQYLQTRAQPADLTKLWAERENESSALIDFADVVWVEAEAKRVFVHTAVGEHLRVFYTLKELEPRLTPHNFVRIHKAVLANLDYVDAIEQGFSGTYIVIMRDAARSRLPMSRQYGRQLRDRLRGG